MRFNLDEDEVASVYKEFSGLPKDVDDGGWRKIMYDTYIRGGYDCYGRYKNIGFSETFIEMIIKAEEEKEMNRRLGLIREAIEL